MLRYKRWYEHSFHKGAITSVAFNPCGKILAAGSLDGLVSVWEVNTGSVLHCINARTPVHSLAWSSGPEGFIFGCENGTLVSVFLEQVISFNFSAICATHDTPKATIKSTYFHAHSGPIRCLSPHLNSPLLISGAADQVTIWKRDHSALDGQRIVRAGGICANSPHRHRVLGSVQNNTTASRSVLSKRRHCPSHLFELALQA